MKTKLSITKVILGLFLLLFGALTVFKGGTNLFTEHGIETRGVIVPLVLWFNFITGFFYIATGILVLQKNAYAKYVARLIALTSTAVFLYLVHHVFSGGEYQTKTLIAMTFRTSIWIALAIYFFKSKFFSSEA